MRIAILGAAGMLGRKLANDLVHRGNIAGQQIKSLVLHDVFATSPPASVLETTVLVSDFSGPGAAAEIVATKPDVIFHLAAVVSGEAEADLEKGYRVNLDGTFSLLEAIRAVGLHYRPRLVFTSSIAVFGSPLPDVIPDDFALRPLSSYGTQKAIGELLVADYSRRGIIDGISIRLPTICVRPGRPNRAASSFYSGIIREPLNGEQSILPVSIETRHWFASPRAAVGFLIHAAELDLDRLIVRSITMPGVSATVADEIEALRKVGGEAAVALIRSAPDPTIDALVGTWPKAFNTERALDLGFVADQSFDEIVAIYREDELGR